MSCIYVDEGWQLIKGELVYSKRGLPKLFKNKKWRSHAACARDLRVGESIVVQETSGAWEGWFRMIKRTSKTQFTISRPQMDY